MFQSLASILDCCCRSAVPAHSSTTLNLIGRWLKTLLNLLWTTGSDRGEFAESSGVATYSHKNVFAVTFSLFLASFRLGRNKTRHQTSTNEGRKAKT